MCSKKSDGGLGFNNIREFNLVFLGKHGWRFLTKPNLLVSKIYKAHYFLNFSFLESKLGHNLSYVWRSIFAAQPLVKRGV